jgi:hypothetical protein
MGDTQPIRQVPGTLYLDMKPPGLGTDHFHLVSWLRISGALLLFFLFAFMACTETIFGSLFLLGT